MERLCLDCGKVLKGRSDKKFCDDQCRNSYNNHLKIENSSFMKQVNGILKKNRSILAKLNPDGKTKVTREKMLKHGFNFTYHSHVYETQKGSVYHFCYEYGYLMIENDLILLIKNDNA